MVICILGRQPAFGLAELESRFGAGKVAPFGDVAASVDLTPDAIPFHFLGSVIKFARPLAVFDSIDWPTVMALTAERLAGLLVDMPEGKIKLGLSTYGINVSLKQLQRSGLELKKKIRDTGRSVRIVPNTALELNGAQVIHNRLATDAGCELLLIRDGRQTHLARTLYVQDIDDYARRDFGRPKRDAFVGMLPPKLAQTMLNLAQVSPESRVLDPFCGTGVVLQEAALMGANVYGTDISERMVQFTRDNLRWLRETYRVDFTEKVEAADATTAIWEQPLGSVVTEVYLGRPMTALPDATRLRHIMDECNTITALFLANLHAQLKPGARCCIAVPAWFDGRRFLHLNVVDDLKKMGYNRISFKHTGNAGLVYHRESQTVARELLVITVKE